MTLWQRIRFRFSRLYKKRVQIEQYQHLTSRGARVRVPQRFIREFRRQLFSLLRLEVEMVVEALGPKGTFIIDVLPRTQRGVTIAIFEALDPPTKRHSVSDDRLKSAYHEKLEQRGHFRYLLKDGILVALRGSGGVYFIDPAKPFLVYKPGWWEERHIPIHGANNPNPEALDKYDNRRSSYRLYKPGEKRGEALFNNERN